MAYKRRAMAARRGKAAAARGKMGAARASDMTKRAASRRAGTGPKVGIVVGIPSPKQVMKSLRKKKRVKQARVKSATKGYS